MSKRRGGLTSKKYGAGPTKSKKRLAAKKVRTDKKAKANKKRRTK